ncbi:MAG: helix-turn-helix domain-containing protein [Halobacteriota archaeon]
MSDDDEFEYITRLSDFGLNDKEARLYCNLLKYGAQPPVVIARHMHTYREDVHRTLNALLEKGIVAKSLSAPTVYVAMPPETALDAVFFEHKLEQRKKATLKRELVELAEVIRVDDALSASAGCRYRVLSGPKQVDAVSKKLNSEATSNISSFMLGPMLGVFFLTGQLDVVPDLLRRGVRTRLITDISRANLEEARYALERGVELRHLEPPGGMRFTVYDAITSFVLIRFDPARSLFKDTSLTVFVCESPTYARHLMYHYELVWKQAVDGAERIRALVESG